ncbi:MMPL family transporter [Lactobacillus sp. S2-2]|uniref:MMPL family transporter n=1 Tax=Lactobacillus sp. S2-2 TaxID=2692917 RepID=UPI001F025F04|nr:MMPL family transporter [Lactobacillus sp. S2-2]MCF6515260.1 MMPL family transporter [Lactobacillus sp. S2-2]
MKNFFQSMHKNRIISIIFWLVMVLIAVIFMPNINQISHNSYQNNNVNQKQINQAQALQNEWGRDLNNTNQIFVVYNNPDGKIDNKQQKMIYHSISKVKKDENGIKKITSLKTTPSAEKRLLSNDKSTELLVLDVDNSIVQDDAYANKLRQEFGTEGLSNYVTNQNIINSANADSILSKTNIVGMIIFMIAILIIGIIFRSIIAPIILLISNSITYLISVSLIMLLTEKFKLSFSYYSNITILISSVAVGTLISFYIIRRFEELISKEDDNEIKTVTAIMEDFTYQIAIVTLILAIALGSLFLINYAPIQAFSSIAITIIITAIGTANIVTFFLQILGKSIFWPRNKLNNQSNHKIWQKLSNFSLWQPMAGIILSIYIIFPFAISYKSNLTYNVNNNDISNNQAITGRDVTNLHFNNGKTTPVKIYVKNYQKFNNANTLLAIDKLTSKLQANPDIKNVYSITQPGGVPVDKYQLSNQLAIVNKRLSSVQSTLSNTNRSLKANIKNINTKNLNGQITKLNQNRIDLTKLNNSITNTQNNLSNSISNVESTPTIKLTKKQKKQKRQQKQLQESLNQVNQELNDSINDLSDLQSSINNNSDNSSNHEIYLKKYYYQLRRTKTNLTRANKSVQSSNKVIRKNAKYLNNLQKADITKAYYITAGQMEDTDFYQSMYNFNSSNQQITMLEVNMKDSPDNSSNHKRINKLEQQVNTMIQGSRLKNSDISYSGIPIDNAKMQQDALKFIPITLGIMMLILWIGLIIVSRSILHPLYWILTYVLSAFAGLQISQMTISYLTNDSLLDSNSILLIITPLLILATAELVPLARTYRKDNPDMMYWLSYEINDFGQKVRYLIFGTILIALGFAFGGLNTFLYVLLTIIITTILFNITLPLMATALGKLAIELPKSKLHEIFKHNKKS